MSTVDYTRYTRIIHCRPCYNVYIMHSVSLSLLSLHFYHARMWRSIAFSHICLCVCASVCLSVCSVLILKALTWKVHCWYAGTSLEPSGHLGISKLSGQGQGRRAKSVKSRPATLMWQTWRSLAATTVTAWVHFSNLGYDATCLQPSPSIERNMIRTTQNSRSWRTLLKYWGCLRVCSATLRHWNKRKREKEKGK